MSNTSRTTSGSNTSQTTPEYNSAQTGMLEQFFSQFLPGANDGSYQAQKALENNANATLDWLMENKDSVQDPQLLSLLEATKGKGWFKFPKMFSQEYRAEVVDYLKQNPAVLAAMGVGQENSKWAESGGQTYEAPDFNSSPMGQMLEEDSDWRNSGAFMSALRSASKIKDYNGNLGSEYDTAYENVQNVNDRWGEDKSVLNKVYGQGLKAQDVKYRDSLDNIDAELETAISDLLQENKISLEDAKSILATTNVKYKDGSIPVTSKRQMGISQLLADMANQKYNTGVSGKSDIYNAKRSTATDKYSTGTNTLDKLYGADSSFIDNNRTAELGEEEFRSQNAVNLINSIFSGEMAKEDAFLSLVNQTAPNQSTLSYITGILNPNATQQQQVGFNQGVTNSTGNSNSSQHTSGPGFLQQVAAGITGGANVANSIKSLF